MSVCASKFPCTEKIKLYVILNEWLLLFIGRFEHAPKWVYLQRCLVVAWLLPCEMAAISAHSVYICIITHHFMQSHIRRVYACLAVCITCHLHFWQNGHDSFTCYCGNRCGTDTEIKAQKVDHGEENSPASWMCESCENITMIATSLCLTACDVMKKSGMCSRRVRH